MTDPPLDPVPLDPVPHTVLFDLDGTIVDSKPGIVAGIRAALAAVDADPGPDHDWDSYIGPALRPMLAERHDLTGADLDRAIDTYLTSYDTSGKYDLTPYPGVVETLADLASGGRQVALATTKRRWLAVDIVEHVGVAPHLHVVAGAAADGTGGDKATLIRHVLDHLGVDEDGLDGVAMVGDRHHDIVGARTIGVTAIGVLWGYGSAAELTDAGAHHLVADADALRSVLGLNRP